MDIKIFLMDMLVLYKVGRLDIWNMCNRYPLKIDNVVLRRAFSRTYLIILLIILEVYDFVYETSLIIIMLVSR